MLFSGVEGRAPKAASTLTLGDVNLALTKIHNAPDATVREGFFGEEMRELLLAVVSLQLDMN